MDNRLTALQATHWLDGYLSLGSQSVDWESESLSSWARPQRNVMRAYIVRNSILTLEKSMRSKRNCLVTSPSIINHRQ